VASDLDVDITIKNYRCFSDEAPARVAIRDGFTAFLGPNNAGKSALLRFFYEFRTLFGICAGPNGTFGTTLMDQPQGFGLNGPLDPAEMFHNMNERDITIQIDFPNRPPLPTRLTLTIKRPTNTFAAALFLDDRRLRGNQFAGPIPTLVVEGGQVDMERVFAVMTSLASTLLIGPFRNVLNIGGADNYFDIQVGEAFVRAWRNLKNGPNKAQAETTHRLTQDIKELFGFGDLTIEAANDDRTLQVFVDGKPYRLAELGAGLAQFIIVLCNVMVRKADFVLIDEPELNLHPTLQMDFLTTLAAAARRGVLFSTHSLGLADAMAGRIYSLTKKGSHVEMKDFERTADLAQLLGELSYATYSELGFEKLLMVEGSTDMPTFRQFLRKIGKSNKVALMHLGGSSTINANCEHQLAEAKRIEKNVAAVIDSERTGEGAALDAARQGFAEECGKQGIPVCVLDRRAMEHYFTERAIRAVKGAKYTALTAYEDRDSHTPMWSKAENWRIAREMTWDEVRDTDLGRFLEGL
jgi:energy-coupling factor transporter ATP-binding protein EcfA2